jgi:hypothetical protein
VVPWGPLGGIAGTCLVLAVLSSLVPAALGMRSSNADRGRLRRRRRPSRPVELAGVRE